ncbi:unnamed protein product [Fraxinus pennsylvanica]|uniref:Uncharacterized protein n=28 Tax=lamiids TaxID=91888 RepID=A0AAD2ED73_9LAMI|nr:unnamed protein product [Fraxinus pennsylvanica]
MAAYSNRSPSPLSTRPGNPNPKISESNSGPRRSFTGNPNSRPSVHTNPKNFYPSTPANSPSDFARRRSVGKEGIVAKENDDHNLKAANIRQAGSGSKNFMSPTISAASKFTPSPRKKVLVERNDPVRTSISLSDGKAVFLSANSEDTEPKSDMDSNLNKVWGSSLDSKVSDTAERDAALEGPPVSKPLKRVTFLEVPSDSENTFESMSDTVIIDSDCFNENKTSCSSGPPVIAPLDADPSMPPYDPKTNYLSPRPQFLHYKPNPRIKILLNKGREIDSDEFKKLEDSFMSEIISGSNSDSEGTEESSQNETSEDTSSIKMVLGVDEKEENKVLEVNEKEEETLVSDSLLPISTTVPDVISEENFEAKRDKKSWVFPRLKCFSLLLMFLIACVCVSVLATDSSVIRASKLKDLSLTNLYHQSRAAAFTKVNLDGFVRNVNQYSVDSLSYISKLITDFGRENKLGTLQFMNSTDLQYELMIDDHFMMKKQFSKEFEENEMEENLDAEFQEIEEEVSAEVDSNEIIEKETEVSNVLEENLEENEMKEDSDAELQEVEDEGYAEIDSDEIIETEVKDVYPASPAQLPESEPDSQVNMKNEGEIVSYINVEQKSDTISEDQFAINSMDRKIQSEANIVNPEISKTEKIEGSNDLDRCTQADLKLLDHENSSKIDSLNKGVEGTQVVASKLSQVDGKFAVVGVSCLVVTLLAAAAFTHRNQRTSTSSKAVSCTDPLSSKKTIYGLAGDVGHVYQEKHSSQNWTTEDVSCRSEVSSFVKNSSSSHSKRRVSNEAQSHDRKARKFSKRESLASSSSEYSGSVSYGSFTTYERIPIKHVNGDEEIITPVRRSSRLINQFRYSRIVIHNRRTRVYCKNQESENQSNGEEPPESLFMKELKRRGMTPTSLLEEENRSIESDDQMKFKEEDRSFSLRNAVRTDSEINLLNQREQSMALNSEGLEGLIPRAKLLLTLGGTFFLAFWPLILVTVASFAALYLYFGPSFVHNGSDTPVSSPQYIDPSVLLEEERIYKTAPSLN